MLAVSAGAMSSDPRTVGGSRQYFLAEVIRTSDEDDSLALEHSLLRDPTEVERMEKHWAIYVATWFFMIIVSLWVMIKDLRYWWNLKDKYEDAKERAEDSGQPMDPKEEAHFRERFLLGPEHGTSLFDGAHHLGYTVRNGVTTSAALDAIYSVNEIIKKADTRGEKWVKFWLNQPDGQAVRNRLKLTYLQIHNELCRLHAMGHREIKFLVLACGSAQASIEAVADFLYGRDDLVDWNQNFIPHDGVKVNLVLVDLNEPSLRRAARLAEKRRVSHTVHIVAENLNDFVLNEQDSSWDLIEMVGFLDYRKVESVVRICGQIRRLLKHDGLFVGAHICPNPWQFVVRWVINWPLLRRRTPEQYVRLLKQAGFLDDEITTAIEPNKIYVLSYARKDGIGAAA